MWLSCRVWSSSQFTTPWCYGQRHQLIVIRASIGNEGPARSVYALVPAMAGRRNSDDPTIIPARQCCGMRALPGAFRVSRQRLFAITHTDDEWRKLLTPDQFAILAKRHRAAIHQPAAPREAAELSVAPAADAISFSATKFDSGTGWPSSGEPLEAWKDRGQAFGMVRTAFTQPLRWPPWPCSMTARPPDCAIASTGSPWSSSQVS